MIQRRVWHGRGKSRFHAGISHLCGVVIPSKVYLKQFLRNNGHVYK